MVAVACQIADRHLRIRYARADQSLDIARGHRHDAVTVALGPIAWPEDSNLRNVATTMRRVPASVNASPPSTRARHIGRQPCLETLLKVGNAQWPLAAERNNGAAGRAKQGERHACGLGPFHNRFDVPGRNNVTGLIFAEPESV